MTRVGLDGVTVDYELTGAGPPVLLPHARPFVSWYRPLLAELPDRAVLSYRRPAVRDRPFGIEDDARLCAGLLAHLGIENPHVVGHSYGGLVALELARRREIAPRSLVLLEPATTGLLAPEIAAARMAGLQAAGAAEPVAAMGQFLRVVCGADGPGLLDRLVPGALGEAYEHAAGFFAVELPAAIGWSFGPVDAGRVEAPVLYLRGAASSPQFADGAAIIESLFPAADRGVLAGANHLMMAQRPVATAGRLEQFWRTCG